jgi:signal transduction histidine kinase
VAECCEIALNFAGTRRWFCQWRTQGREIESGKMSGILDRFTTSKPTGTGLGLALSRMIIEGHDGEISVSDGEASAQFEITLPIERRESSDDQGVVGR